MPFCRDCGKEVQDDWKTCPHCSSSLNGSAGINVSHDSAATITQNLHNVSSSINLSHDNNTIKAKFMRIANVLVYLLPIIFVLLGIDLILGDFELSLILSNQTEQWAEQILFYGIPLLVLIHIIRWRIDPIKYNYKLQQSNIHQTATPQNTESPSSNFYNTSSGKTSWIREILVQGVVEIIIGVLAIIIFGAASL